MAKEWHPAALLEGDARKPYAVIVLNQPINKSALSVIIQNSTMLVCADAGADRLLKYEESQVNKRQPDAIVGDLDSVSARTKDYYSSLGTEISHDPDQYSTDFTKSLKWIRQKWSQQYGETFELDVVVMGGLGGRVDQGFSQIHHLYMVLQQPDLLVGSIYLLSEQSLSFVLDNDNIVHVNDRVFAENVGIIPVLGLTHITTSGLEWDVFNWPTEFGGQVSTSNHIRSDTIKVTSHGPRPLLTLELAPNLCAMS